MNTEETKTVLFRESQEKYTEEHKEMKKLTPLLEKDQCLEVASFSVNGTVIVKEEIDSGVIFGDSAFVRFPHFSPLSCYMG